MAWNKPKENHPTPKPTKSPSVKRSILAGVIVAVLGGLCIYLFTDGDAASSTLNKKDPTRNIREVSPAKAGNATASNTTERLKTEEPKKDETWLGTKIDHRTARTNGTMIIETIYTVDGKSHLYYRDTTPQVFDNASDQILALATADAPGGNAPPLPSLGPKFEDEFARSLKKEIVINEDDSDAVKEVKARVKQARQDLLDAMGAGMSAQDVLMEHRKMQENNAAMRMDAVKGLREYLDKGDTEGAREYVEKMNQALEQMGIMKIELPRSREEILAERQAHSAARRAQKEEMK